VGGGLIGRALLTKWHVSLPALMLTGGIVFFMVAIRQLLEQYEPPRPPAPAEPLPASPLAAACRLVFPIVLTPYGIAAVIALLASSEDTARTVLILGLLTLVMCLDWLAMLFARFILRGFAIIVLQVIGGGARRPAGRPVSSVHAARTAVLERHSRLKVQDRLKCI
jgi:multiple antibiotic resistance protein